MGISETTLKLIHELTSRDLRGQKKYGTSLDRRDLTSSEWHQHLLEELLDAACYVLRAKQTMEENSKSLNELYKIHEITNENIDDKEKIMKIRVIVDKWWAI